MVQWPVYGPDPDTGKRRTKYSKTKWKSSVNPTQLTGFISNDADYAAYVWANLKFNPIDDYWVKTVTLAINANFRDFEKSIEKGISTNFEKAF